MDIPPADTTFVGEVDGKKVRLVRCPTCSKEVVKRGYTNHWRLKHGGATTPIMEDGKHGKRFKRRSKESATSEPEPQPEPRREPDEREVGGGIFDDDGESGW